MAEAESGASRPAGSHGNASAPRRPKHPDFVFYASLRAAACKTCGTMVWPSEAFKPGFSMVGHRFSHPCADEPKLGQDEAFARGKRFLKSLPLRQPDHLVAKTPKLNEISVGVPDLVRRNVFRCIYCGYMVVSRISEPCRALHG